MGSWAELAPLKSVKASHKAHGANNEFKALFTEVEIHNDFDLDNFILAEIDFEHIYKKLNLHKKQFARKLTFRVRKIRGGSVAGRYYPTHRTLIVDVKHMDSMAHEWAHLMDYEWNGTGKQADMLSKQPQFENVKALYTENFKANNGRGGSYYLNDTEIFARAFEVYVTRKFGDNQLCESMASYQRAYRNAYYGANNEELMQAVDTYFNTLFGLHITAVK